MLRVASFSLTDAAGVNAHLDKYPLASGMHILVSEGNIMLPYEDGQPKTAAVRICEIGEQKNTMTAERDIIEHSQGVMELLMADAQNRVNVAQADVDKAEASKDKKTYNADERAKLTAKLKEAQQAYDQVANQHRTNAHEIVRLNVNIEKMDEAIAALHG